MEGAYGKTAMHSISTSVPRGSCLAATHLLRREIPPIVSSLCEMGSRHGVRKETRDREKAREGKERRNSRPARFALSPIQSINLIHRGEILHIRDENVDLDDIFNRRSRSFENCREIFNHLMLLIRKRRKKTKSTQHQQTEKKKSRSGL